MVFAYDLMQHLKDKLVIPNVKRIWSWSEAAGTTSFPWKEMNNIPNNSPEHEVMNEIIDAVKMQVAIQHQPNIISGTTKSHVR